jgi:hypothetical protein
MRILLGMVILAFTGIQPAGAVRVLKVVESSYELYLTQITLPRSTSGIITFIACDICLRESLDVTPDTQYFLADQSVPLESFNAEASLVRQANAAGRTFVGVHYDVETRDVTRIVMKEMPAN